MPRDTSKPQDGKPSALVKRLRQALQLAESLQQPEAAHYQATPSAPVSNGKYRVERYGNTRNWALYEGETLLGVTVYKRGAETIKHRLEKLEAELQHVQEQSTLPLAAEAPSALITQPSAPERLDRQRTTPRHHTRG